jgi:hypothetical protein
MIVRWACPLISRAFLYDDCEHMMGTKLYHIENQLRWTTPVAEQRGLASKSDHGFRRNAVLLILGSLLVYVGCSCLKITQHLVSCVAFQKHRWTRPSLPTSFLPASRCHTQHKDQPAVHQQQPTMPQQMAPGLVIIAAMMGATGGLMSLVQWAYDGRAVCLR